MSDIHRIFCCSSSESIIFSVTTLQICFSHSLMICMIEYKTTSPTGLQLCVLKLIDRLQQLGTTAYLWKCMVVIFGAWALHQREYYRAVADGHIASKLRGDSFIWLASSPFAKTEVNTWRICPLFHVSPSFPASAFIMKFHALYGEVCLKALQRMEHAFNKEMSVSEDRFISSPVANHQMATSQSQWDVSPALRSIFQSWTVSMTHRLSHFKG